MVTAKGVQGWNIPIWNNIFGAKMTVTCGNCGVMFTTRVPIVDRPTVGCPHCREVNELPLQVTYE